MSRSDEAPVAVRIERTVRASPDRVFRAFLDPALMRQWIVPDDLHLDRISVDPRVGGRIEVWHSRDGVSTGKFEGRFVTIDRPRELVYHWAFVGTEPARGEYYDTLVRIRLRERPDRGTHVTVIHERLDDLFRGAPHLRPRLEPGWANCLEKLERVAGGLSEADDAGALADAGAEDPAPGN